MSRKNETDLLTPMPVTGWFQPHPPVNWTGQLVDPDTGEVKPDPAAISMTKQSFMEECDINNIIKAFSVTGMFQHVNEKAAQGVFTDLPDPLDFQESLHLVATAQASFDSLPSKIRTRFNNDPTQFLEFVANPENQAEMITLGLATDNRPLEPNLAPEASQPPLEPSPK